MQKSMVTEYIRMIEDSCHKLLSLLFSSLKLINMKTKKNTSKGVDNLREINYGVKEASIIPHVSPLTRGKVFSACILSALLH